MRSVRIIAFPKSGIAYNECFYNAVEALHCEVVDGIFTGNWLRHNLRPGDWMHLHWPSFYYGPKVGIWRSFSGISRFCLLILYARARGTRLLWTAHNLLPHERSPQFPYLDIWARHFVIAMAFKIYVHGQVTEKLLIEQFPQTQGKTVVIPHGNWIYHYPNTLTKERAREILGIDPQAYVYLFIGLCRPYKNLHGLVQSFSSLAGENLRLVIAGKFQESSYLAHIAQLSGRDSRILLRPGFVADADLQLYLKACNAVVAPYLDILTSGTAMLAMGFGRPLLSIQAGFLLDVVTPDCGVLFDRDSKQGLSKGLVSIQRGHYQEQKIMDTAKRYTFEDAAAVFVRSLTI